MNSEDGPSYVKIGSTQPVAAKDYKCDSCTKPIVKGEKHCKHIYKDEDDKLISARYHLVCPWEQDQP